MAPRVGSTYSVGLTLLALSLFGTIFASTLLVGRNESFDLWWRTSGPIVLLGVALGVVIYALTTVYGLRSGDGRGASCPRM